MYHEEFGLYLKDLYQETNKLIIFRNILENDIVQKVINLLKELARGQRDYYVNEALYYEIYSQLVNFQEVVKDKNIWESFFLSLLKREENLFSLTCEKSGEKLDEKVHTLAVHDFKILYKLLTLKWGYIETLIASPLSLQNIEKFASPEQLLDYCTQNYVKGAGLFGQFAAFRWDNEKGIVGINNPDTITFENLIGYEEQKTVLLENTEAFIKGRPANNILLFGDKGTGKSSSVKALINRYAKSKLRLLELTKHQLGYFNDILVRLKDRNLRFIIFIDDLSFEEFETEYKYLKALIEGGIEQKPENVIIYATSNRRHLIKETWAERDKHSGDVHVSDTLQEKLSLVDRFGITLTFTTPDQDDYLNIVYGLARQNDINMPSNELREQALKWALWHNGRSGRTARQFINHLLGTYSSSTMTQVL